MSALVIQLPEEKRTRVTLVAKSRKVSVTRRALHCWTKRRAKDPARSAVVSFRAHRSTMCPV